MGEVGVPVRKHPTLLQVFLQAGEEGLGVGPFKKEGKGLKPQRGHFPSWTPEGARALRGLKDRAWAGYGGAGGPRTGQGPRKSVPASEAAAVTSLCHRLRLLGGWGGAGGGGRSEGGGARGSGQAGSRGAERKERGEAVKGPEAGAVGSPVPAGLGPDQRPLPTRPRGAAPRLQTRGVQASPSSSSSAASSAGRGGGRERRVRGPAEGAGTRRVGGRGRPRLLSPPARVPRPPRPALSALTFGLLPADGVGESDRDS